MEKENYDYQTNSLGYNSTSYSSTSFGASYHFSNISMVAQLTLYIVN